MNRMAEIVHVLVVIALGVLTVCPIAGASSASDTSVSKRVHEEIEKFLRARASARVNQIEIPALDAFDRVGVSPQNVTIRLRTRLSGELLGRVPVTVILSNGTAELKRGVVTASLRALAPVLVATRSLRRGAVVGARDFRHERRDLSVLRGSAISREGDLLGMRVRKPINAGRIWQARHLESVPTVKRGEQVRLRLESGGLRIDGTGKAGEDGRVGDWIRVLNNVSKRYVTGQVDEEGVVYVRF